MLNGNIHSRQESLEVRSSGERNAETPPFSALDREAPHLESLLDSAVVVIGRGAKIKGEIVDSARVDIQGEFEGEVASISVIVREGASFVGQMITRQLQVHGSFEGSLVAEELLDIQPTGCVNAEVSYGELSVAFGASLSGPVRSLEQTESLCAAQEQFSCTASTYKTDHDVRMNQLSPKTNSPRPNGKANRATPCSDTQIVR